MRTRLPASSAEWGSESISVALNWRRPQKLALIDGLTKVLEDAGRRRSRIWATVEDLAVALFDEQSGPELRRSLIQIKYVGPKTIDYIAVRSGSVDHVPVDMHIKGFVREAGVDYRANYDRVVDLVKETAKAGGWSTGALDAAIWRYMSDR